MHLHVQLENPPLPQRTPDGYSLSFRCWIELASSDDGQPVPTALVVKLPVRMGPWFIKGGGRLPATVIPGGLNPEEIKPFFDEAKNLLQLLPPPPAADGEDPLHHDSVGRIHIHRLVRVEAMPYPMLFYEPYDDGDRQLRLIQPEQEHEWAIAALQLIAAFDYMHARGLVLAPLGVDNVVRRSAGTPTWNYMLTGFARCDACDPNDRTTSNEPMLTGMRQLAAVLLYEIADPVCLNPRYKSALSGTISAIMTPDKCLRCFQSLRKRVTRYLLASLK